LRRKIPTVVPLVLACVISWCGSMVAQLATVETEVRIKHLGDLKNDNSNVVFWLVPLDQSGQAQNARPGPYRIVQKNKQFHPHVLAVPVGTAVQFPNEDPFFHNVFSMFKGKKFDLGLYEAGSSRTVVFDKPGVSFIFCNIHPDMNAYVLSIDSNYFDISDHEGRIRITGVPYGKYRTGVWYERSESKDLAELSRVIEVGSPSVKLGSIDLEDSPRFQPKHLNKNGKPYDPEVNPY
jgi:plastocyanin